MGVLRAERGGYIRENPESPTHFCSERDQVSTLPCLPRTLFLMRGALVC